MPEQKQYQPNNTTILLDDSDKAIVKNVFANKLELLLLLRKSLLGGEMNANEKTAFVGFSSELVAALRKQFLPTINLENPAAQLIDLWATVHTRDRSVEDAWLEMEARRILIDYLAERFAFLEGKGEGEGKIKLIELEYKRSKSKEQAFIDLLARNTIINHIDINMGILWSVASQVEATKEDLEEKRKRKSTK